MLHNVHNEDKTTQDLCMCTPGFQNILIYTYCKAFGETNQADLLTAYLKKDGRYCIHIGCKDHERIPKPAFQPDCIVVFLNIQYQFWNDSVFRVATEVVSKLLVYTCGIHGYTSRIHKFYPSVDNILTSLDELIVYLCGFSDIKGYEEQIFHQLCMLFPDRTDLETKRIKHAVIATTYKKHYEVQHESTYYRDVDMVVTELQSLLSNYNIQGFHIDDTCLDDGIEGKERCFYLFHKISDKFHDMVFSANLSPSFVLTLDSRDIKLMMDAGLYRVYLDIRTGNQCDLIRYGVGNQISTYQEALNRWKGIGIDIYINFYNFNPYTDQETLIRNVEFLSEHSLCRFALLSTLYIPIKNEMLYKNCTQDKLLMENDSILETCQFKNQDIKYLYIYFIGLYKSMQKNGYHEGAALSEFIYYIYVLANKKYDLGIQESILRSIDSLKHLRSYLSMICAKLFTELLQISSTGWSKQKAEVAAYKYTPVLMDISNQIRKLQKNTIYELYQTKSKNKMWFMEHI